MNIMWVDEQVEALVLYKAGLAIPMLQAIKWNGRRIDFETHPRVERTTNAILYRFDEGSTCYALRFEPDRSQWFLEGVDDSGVVDWPAPRVFAPRNWKR
jgi:hypothetical protein